jgi:hypothetical protein
MTTPTSRPTTTDRAGWHCRSHGGEQTGRTASAPPCFLPVSEGGQQLHDGLENDIDHRRRIDERVHGVECASARDRTLRTPDFDQEFHFASVDQRTWHDAHASSSTSIPRIDSRQLRSGCEHSEHSRFADAAATAARFHRACTALLSTPARTRHHQDPPCSVRARAIRSIHAPGSSSDVTQRSAHSCL